MYTKRIKYMSEEVKNKFEIFIKDGKLQKCIDEIIDTYQTINLICISQDDNNYKILFLKGNVLVKVLIDENYQLNISYLENERQQSEILFREISKESYAILLSIDGIRYEVMIYNYVDPIMIDDIMALLRENGRIESIRDIYYIITSILDKNNTTIIINSLDNANVLNIHHGEVLKYSEEKNHDDETERIYGNDFDGYYIEKTSIQKINDNKRPFMKKKGERNG